MTPFHLNFSSPPDPYDLSLQIWRVDAYEIPTHLIVLGIAVHEHDLNATWFPLFAVVPK